MIDFNNASFVKLGIANSEKAAALLDGVLLPGENVWAGFKGIRDWVIFTDRRLVTVNVQGVTGKRCDFT